MTVRKKGLRKLVAASKEVRIDMVDCVVVGEMKRVQGPECED